VVLHRTGHASLRGIHEKFAGNSDVSTKQMKRRYNFCNFISLWGIGNPKWRTIIH
jgi:hypothetical protein